MPLVCLNHITNWPNFILKLGFFCSSISLSSGDLHQNTVAVNP